MQFFCHTPGGGKVTNWWRARCQVTFQCREPSGKYHNTLDAPEAAPSMRATINQFDPATGITAP